MPVTAGVDCRADGRVQGSGEWPKRKFSAPGWVRLGCDNAVCRLSQFSDPVAGVGTGRSCIHWTLLSLRISVEVALFTVCTGRHREKYDEEIEVEYMACLQCTP